MKLEIVESVPLGTGLGRGRSSGLLVGSADCLGAASLGRGVSFRSGGVATAFLAPTGASLAPFSASAVIFTDLILGTPSGAVHCC